MSLNPYNQMFPVFLYRDLGSIIRLTNAMFLDNEINNNGYLKKANPVGRSSFLNGTMKNRVIKSNLRLFKPKGLSLLIVDPERVFAPALKSRAWALSKGSN